MFDFLTDPQLLAAFVALSALEVILGIDNVIFIALLVQHLPKEQRQKARTIGLVLALFMRILMLMGLAWLMKWQTPLFALFGQEFSGKSLLMLAGGFFLIYKATSSIHEEMTDEEKEQAASYSGGFVSTIAQIIVIDIVFSFDSVLTAVGLTDNVPVIVAAMTVAMVVMLFASGGIAALIERFPTLKMLALAFILVIGVFLMAEGLGLHIPRGYIYFSMAFSLGVETLNLLAGRRTKAAKKKK